MPKRVKIPNVGMVSFPDEMDDAAITQAIETEIMAPFAAEKRGVSPEGGNSIFKPSQRVNVPVASGKGSTAVRTNAPVKFDDEVEGAMELLKEGAEAGKDFAIGTGKRLYEPAMKIARGLRKIPRAPGQAAYIEPGETLRGMKDVATGAADLGITALMPWITAGGAAGSEALNLPDVSVSEQSAAGIAEGVRKMLEAEKRRIPNLPMALQPVVPLEATAGALETAMGAMTPTSKFLNLLTKAGPLAEESEAMRYAMAPMTEYFKPTTEEGTYAAEIGDFALPLGVEGMLRMRKAPFAAEKRGISPEGGKIPPAMESYLPPTFRRDMIKKLVKQGEDFMTTSRLDDAALEKLYTEKGLNVAAPADEAPGSAGRGAANAEQIRRFEEMQVARKPLSVETENVSTSLPEGERTSRTEGERVSPVEFGKVTLPSTKRPAGNLTREEFAKADVSIYPAIASMSGEKIKPEMVMDAKLRKLVERGEYADTPDVFKAKGKEEGIPLRTAVERYNEMLPEGAEHLTDYDFLQKLNEETAKFENGFETKYKITDVNVGKENYVDLSRLNMDEATEMRDVVERIMPVLQLKYEGLDDVVTAKILRDVQYGMGKEKNRQAQVILNEARDAIAVGGIEVMFEGERMFVPLEELRAVAGKEYGVGSREAGSRVMEPAAFAAAGLVPYAVSTGDEKVDRFLKLLGAGGMAAGMAKMGGGKEPREKPVERKYEREFKGEKFTDPENGVEYKFAYETGKGERPSRHKFIYEPIITPELELKLKEVQRQKNISKNNELINSLEEVKGHALGENKNDIVRWIDYLKKDVENKPISERFIQRLWYSGAKQYIANAIRKNGGKRYYKSEKDVSGSVYYEFPDGRKIRLSDHELPMVGERAMRAEFGDTKRGWSDEIVLDRIMSKDELDNIIKERFGIENKNAVEDQAGRIRSTFESDHNKESGTEAPQSESTSLKDQQRQGDITKGLGESQVLPGIAAAVSTGAIASQLSDDNEGGLFAAGLVPYAVSTGDEKVDRFLKLLGAGGMAAGMAGVLKGKGESGKFGEMKNKKGAGKELPSEQKPLKPEGRNVLTIPNLEKVPHEQIVTAVKEARRNNNYIPDEVVTAYLTKNRKLPFSLRKNVDVVLDLKRNLEELLPDVDVIGDTKYERKSISILAGSRAAAGNVETIPGGKSTGVGLSVFVDTKGNPYVGLYELNVAENLQGQGVGKKIVEAIAKTGLKIHLQTPDFSKGFWTYLKETNPEWFTSFEQVDAPGSGASAILKPAEKTSPEPPQRGGQFTDNINLNTIAATAAGAGLGATALLSDDDDSGLFAAGVMASAVMGKMTPKVRGVFDAMQRHVRGMYEGGEIRGGQLGEALRAVAKEYVTKGDGRFLPVEEQRQILGASGALNKQMLRKMMTRDYKAQTDILEYARKLELNDKIELKSGILEYGRKLETKDRERLKKEAAEREEKGESPDDRLSLLEANWVTQTVWDGMKDRVMDELNSNGKYAKLGREGRRELFKMVEKNYRSRIERSIEAITGGAHGFGPDMYSLTSGGTSNPYARYEDLSMSQARNMDLYMATEKVFGKDAPLVKKGILDPLDDAKGRFADDLRERLRMANAVLVKELGIKKGSKESAVVQNLGEGAKFFEFDKETGELLSDNSLTGRVKLLFGIQKKMPLGSTDATAVPVWLKDKIGEGAKIITDRERQDGRVGETILVSMPYSFGDAVRDIGRDGAERAVKGAEFLRNDYNKLISEANTVLAKIYPGQPDKLIRKRKDYMRHWNELQNDLGGLLNLFEAPEVIDSRLAGISAETEPKSSWQSIRQRRFGVISKEDAVGGYLNYLPAAMHIKHIDPMIQRLRGFRKVLAESTVKSTNINRYIELINDVANELAGKTDTFDRGWMSRFLGRSGMRSVNRTNNLIKANAVMANLGSALVQPANAVNGYANLGKGAEKYIVLGARDAFVDMMSGNKKSGKDSFMSERYLDKELDKFVTGIFGGHVYRNAKRLMRVGDEITARLLWHSFYNKAIAEGIPEPGRFAGNQTRKSVGGRGLAEQSAADRSKVLRLVMPLTREVRNSWLLVKDAAHRRDMMWMGRFIVSSFVMNQFYRQIFGESRTLDLGGALIDAFKIMDESDEETQVAIAQGIGRIGGEVLSNIPGGQLITEQLVPEGVRRKYLGRSDPSRFGQGVGLVPSLMKSIWKGGQSLLEEDFERTGSEALNIGSKVLLPFGGGQVKKTLKGLAALKEGGVENDTGYESFEDILDQMRAVTVGPGQTQAARRLYGN